MQIRRLRSRSVGWGVVAAGVLIAALVAITWKATNPLLFLLYPVLVLGVLGLLGLAVLWALKHV